MSSEVEDVPMLKAKGRFDPLFEALRKELLSDNIVIGGRRTYLLRIWRLIP